MRLAWACGAFALVCCAARGQEPERPVALSDLMRPGWGAAAPWGDGLSEVAEYEGREVRDGRVRESRVVVVTGAEDFGPEARARAEWPYGSRKVVEAMRQRVFSTPRDEDALATFVDFFADRKSPNRLLWMSVNRPSWEGTVTREFDSTTARAMERWSSFRESEGRGERVLDSETESLFEEQLPLLVRGLQFREGARAWLSLKEPVSTGSAKEVAEQPAVLSITRAKETPKLPMRGWTGEAPWIATVECGDGRRVVLTIANEAPNVVLACEWSDGRSWGLAALGRRVFSGS